MIWLRKTIYTNGVYQHIPFIAGLGAGDMWPDWESDNDSFMQPAKTMPIVDSDYCYLNIEQWNLTNTPYKSYDKRAHGYHINRFLKTFQKFKALNLDVNLTSYNIPGAYWPFDFEKADYRYAKEWAKQWQPIYDALDFISPSLYMVDESQDPAQHYRFMNEAVDLDKKLSSKPVIPFIWHRYIVGENYIGDDNWYMMLDFVQENCDGAIIWDGYISPFDDYAQKAETILKQFI